MKEFENLKIYQFENERIRNRISSNLSKPNQPINQSPINQLPNQEPRKVSQESKFRK